MSLKQEISGSGQLDRDIEHPLGTLFYAVSCMHCMTMALAQGGEGSARCGSKKDAGLPAPRGFTSIAVNALEHDVQNNWYVVRK